VMCVVFCVRSASCVEASVVRVAIECVLCVALVFCGRFAGD
jgi:hypothetical protein